MKTPTRQNYINRLESLGYPRHSAMRIVYDFFKDYGEQELIEWLQSIEKDKTECGLNIMLIQ